MEHWIVEIESKILVGKCMEMSYVDNKTAELWKSFMMSRKTVKSRVDDLYYSLQVYSKAFDYKRINPHETFTKWAGVEVANTDDLPENMSSYQVEGGLYAVFVHVGPASEFAKSFEYIFGTWLPKSGYEVDNRAHFEVLKEGYNPTDVDATEEIWIPIIKSESFEKTE